MLLKSAVFALSASLAAALPALEVEGNSFVNPKTGNRFQIIGVDYQPGGSAGYNPKTGIDPLSHEDTCLRDAALLQVLGVNSIRVYNLDPNLNHDKCVSIFNDAGIYIIIDVNSPLVGEAITSFEPWTSYYDSYLNRTFAIVENFKNYDNTLMFFSGNEVIDKEETAATVPRYLRAVTRDLKNYIKKHSDRKIPVGYSAADVREVLWDTYNYLVCDNDESEDEESFVDVFALNSYSWCGDSSFKSSTFDKLVEGFKDSPVPIYFSEFGCNEVTPRLFTEIGTIYSDKMYDVFSGGLVYEYTQEANNYGLVQVDKDGSVELLQDFNTLAAQYKKLDIKDIQSKKPAEKKTRPKCSSKLITEKGFDSNFTIPSLPDDDSAKILDKGVNPKPSGKFVKISNYETSYKVTDTDGKTISNLAVKPVESDEMNAPGFNDVDTGSSNVTSKNSNSGETDSEDDDSAATYVAPTLAVVAASMLALF